MFVYELSGCGFELRCCHVLQCLIILPDFIGFIGNKGWCFYCFIATAVGAPIGITSPSLCLVFSISNGTAKKTFKNNEKKKRKETQ